MSRMKNPNKLKHYSCKIGTIPMLKIVDGRCHIEAGNIIRVRDALHASNWERAKVTLVNPDGYFFADLV